VTVLFGSRRAGAQESHLHVGLAAGHAVVNPQASEFGFGGQVGAGYELRFAKIIGAQIAIDAYDLAQGSPPANPAFAQHGQGYGFDGQLGVRLRPFGTIAAAGLWLDATGGAGYAGSLLRPVFEAAIGYDVIRIEDPSWEIGPFVGYTQIFQPSDTLRPEDAHVIWLGLHIDLAAHGTPRERPDSDGDGVFDDEDACPQVAGVRTNDPKTNGCPPPASDRDADGVPDREDACPDVPGVRTTDPKTNGCPPDRDGDGVPDREDACPDVPGVRTDDPKTNGCPLPPDRDKDGILDADDACPDVPGVRTDDPKTNGCPKASDLVRVEGDQILLGEIIHFDTGSPHVHHASWPLVKKVADFIEHNADIEVIDIQGNADEVGTSEYNLYLSQQRAASVRGLLIHFGVASSKLTEHAYGKDRPREAGHDERAHRENRRVEFTITRARQGTTPAQPAAPNATPNGPK
jgi:OmpA-OmpF porin, OOP family